MFDLPKPKEKQSTDHLGNVYPSFKKMCEHYHLRPQVVYARLSLGYSLEKALTTNNTVTYKGVTYSSFSELFRHFNLNPHIARNRLNLRWSLEKTLTTPVNYRSPCVFYKNTRYKNKQVLCDTFGIHRTSFDKYLAKGMTIDQAVDKLLERHQIFVGDQVFYNVNEIARAFNVSARTVTRTIKATQDKNARLLLIQQTQKRNFHNNSCWICNGKEIARVEEMMKITGMSMTWCSRMLSEYRDGKTPIIIPTTDHLGNSFDSFKEMCLFHKVTATSAMKTILKTGDVKTALCQSK